MFPESKVTEIYCMADDFCKEFTFQQEKYMIEDKKTKHRNKPNCMSEMNSLRFILSRYRPPTAGRMALRFEEYCKQTERG